ncbi:hypothetical protein AVEN_42886-1 [Araneus ventricosus]|uniref:Uncharacterized protein n=1 Tax=Araneus ventricosus TaxID=182803 RepID=A0A4Y2AGJ6_ARAVE|nr:hypothetical protein AVEN_42886-1 [Araneus ventricosus]
MPLLSITPPFTPISSEPPESRDSVLGQVFPVPRAVVAGVGHQFDTVEPGAGADGNGLGGQGHTRGYQGQSSQKAQRRPDHGSPLLESALLSPVGPSSASPALAEGWGTSPRRNVTARSSIEKQSAPLDYAPRIIDAVGYVCVMVSRVEELDENEREVAVVCWEFGGVLLHFCVSIVKKGKSESTHIPTPSADDIRGVDREDGMMRRADERSSGDLQWNAGQAASNTIIEHT